MRAHKRRGTRASRLSLGRIRRAASSAWRVATDGGIGGRNNGRCLYTLYRRCEVYMRLSSDEVAGLLRPTVAPAKRAGPLEHALRARLSVLMALAHFSHLRAVEVGAACWPAARSGLQLAQRCLKRLAEAREVRGVSNSVGTTSFVLTHTGTRTLRLHGLCGKHGLNIRSFAGGSFLHHAINSRYAIEQRNLGHECHTEYGISAGFAPFSTVTLRRIFKKSCDGLLIRNAPGGSQSSDKLVWVVEVEAARKPASEIMRILSIAELVGRRIDDGQPYVIGGVVFAFNEAQDHEAYIRKTARSLWHQRPSAERAMLAGRITFAKMRYELPLSFQALTEDTLKL
jgi:hypothetical protein